MQYQALRKEASSKLMLFTTVVMLLLLIALPVFLWITMDNVMASLPLEQNSVFDVSSIIKAVTIVVLLPVIGVNALPVIAMFMIYTNARSGRLLKRTGFSILRGYMIALIVISAIAVFSNLLLVQRGSGHALLLTCAVLGALIELLIAIISISVLSAAREVVTYGGTPRKVNTLLPVLMIASACLSALQLLLTVLANTVPSLTEKLQSFRVATASGFYAHIAYSALGLVSSFLFILLCFRGIKALSQPTELPPQP